MLHVISGKNREENRDLMDQMFRLRARQFADRRNWRVNVIDGREIDMFDELDPLYIIVSNGRGQLLASLRLLPTLGPHMLSDVFPEVMGENAVVRHPLIWESSRFCVDTEAARDHAPDGINRATRDVLQGLFQTAHDAGLINIVSVYDLFVERILKRAGCSFDRLGPVVTYDEGLKTTAGLFEVSEAVIRQIGGHPVAAGPDASANVARPFAGTTVRPMAVA